MVLAAIDYAYQLWRTSQDMMMTKEEVKDEVKNQEGDAKTKARMRSRRKAATQRKMLAAVPKADVVITTAVVPGRKAPVLVTSDMVRAMAPGSVVVDLAAERGGNCELTRAGETVVEHGVTIVGAINLAGAVPYHASQMYARTLVSFVLHLLKDGAVAVDLDDEITRETLVTLGGEVVHPRAGKEA